MATSQHWGEPTLQVVDPNINSQRIDDVDLDQQTDANAAKSDLRFTAGRGTMMFYALVPVGQAIVTPYGKSPSSYGDCLRAVATMSADNMPEVEQGMYFCVKADRNMLASVWVQS